MPNSKKAEQGVKNSKRPADTKLPGLSADMVCLLTRVQPHCENGISGCWAASFALPGAFWMEANALPCTWRICQCQRSKCL